MGRATLAWFRRRRRRAHHHPGGPRRTGGAAEQATCRHVPATGEAHGRARLDRCTGARTYAGRLRGAGARGGPVPTEVSASKSLHGHPTKLAVPGPENEAGGAWVERPLARPCRRNTCGPADGVNPLLSPSSPSRAPVPSPFRASDRVLPRRFSPSHRHRHTVQLLPGKTVTQPPQYPRGFIARECGRAAPLVPGRGWGRLREGLLQGSTCGRVLASGRT
jgi:hypothetical protein